MHHNESFIVILLQSYFRMKLKITLGLLSLLFAGWTHAQQLIYFPDISGYYTLACDFHTHTVFSDGNVWPGFRVEEAMHDGLQAIAITDHIEYRTHMADLKADHNRAYEIARDEARKTDLIVIHGTEITRGMPPGHFNALFIEDANRLDRSDFMEAMAEAEKQAAFIIWNHPGWKFQQPDTVKWFPVHDELLAAGMLDGIEVCNYTDYYPEALQWALDKKLCMFANSDVHNATSLAGFNKHRPVTLVFASEKSEKGIREALEHARTACYFGDTIIATEPIARQLLDASLEISYNYRPDTYELCLHFRNKSGCPVLLTPHFEVYGVPDVIHLKAYDAASFTFKWKNPQEDLQFTVKNYITAPNRFLDLHINIK